jgi:hypothetical protein
VAYQQTWANNTPASSCVVSLTSPNPSAGWVMYLVGLTDAATANDFITPSGWSLIGTQAATTTDGMCAAVFRKVSTGLETSVTLATNSSNNCIAGVLAFSGIDNVTPEDNTVGQLTSSTANTTTDVSATSLAANVDWLRIQCQDNGNSDYPFGNAQWSTTAGSPNSWTSIADQRSGFYNWGAAWQAGGAAGALTARCVTTSGGRAGWLIPLRPAAGAAVSFPPPTRMAPAILAM